LASRSSLETHWTTKSNRELFKTTFMSNQSTDLDLVNQRRPRRIIYAVNYAVTCREDIAIDLHGIVLPEDEIIKVRNKIKE
jgi:hypothetical protein